MTADSRRRMLDVLADVWDRHQDSRLGQLVENIAMWARGPGPEAVYDVEDETFLKAMQDHLASLSEPVGGPLG